MKLCRPNARMSNAGVSQRIYARVRDFCALFRETEGLRLLCGGARNRPVRGANVSTNPLPDIGHHDLLVDIVQEIVEMSVVELDRLVA